VWTLIVHGKTEHAYGWLQPEWEVDALTVAENARTRYGRSSEEIESNQPPAIKIDPVQSATVSRPLTLTVRITDDGLPPLKPRRPPRAGLASLSAPPTPTNLPTYRSPLPPQNGLSVLWMVYRGPADVVFDPPDYQPAQGDKGDEKKSAKAVTTAKFSRAGTYVLRAVAADGLAMTPADVTVTVIGSKSDK